jgi:ABC-type Fe3+/spermidine/putrescine transport system ATPase subunit
LTLKTKIENKTNDYFVAENLSKTYIDFSLKVDFEIKKGEFLSILGPSGSGKSTILKLIAGFEKPDTGTINMFGKNITKLDTEKRNVGVVFQDYTLFPHLNVFENIAYGLKVRKINKNSIHKKVDEMLNLLNMKGYEKRKPQELSGGEQQRVAIARALVINPNIFLLDEPFSSLDTNLRKNIRREISQIQRKLNITTIFITHNQEEALSISDKILLIKDGTPIQFGKPSELYEHPINEFAAFFLGDANMIDGKMIRPENFKVFSPKTFETQKHKQDKVIEGKIINREYFGSYYQLYIKTAEYGTLIARVTKAKDFDINSNVLLTCSTD